MRQQPAGQADGVDQDERLQFHRWAGLLEGACRGPLREVESDKMDEDSSRGRAVAVAAVRVRARRSVAASQPVDQEASGDRGVESGIDGYPMPADAAASPMFRRGVALFNAGYYWEAHEAWEGLWHAYGRRGPTADVLKALIKLAAAGVKVREGQRARRAHPRASAPRTVRQRRSSRAASSAWARSRRVDRAVPSRSPTARPRDPGRPARRRARLRVSDRSIGLTIQDSRLSRGDIVPLTPGTAASRRPRASASTPAMIMLMTPCEPPSTKP